MSADMLDLIRTKTNVAMRQFPESVGTARIYDFDLVVLPPWCDYEEDEVLRIDITSAAVFCVVNSKYLLLVEMVDEAGRIDLPAGGKKKIDKSPEELAVRELREEAGLSVRTSDLEPFGYAWREKGKKRSQKRKTGGIQYLLQMEISIPHLSRTDDSGRIFMFPFEGADLNEVKQLVLEPLDVFLSGGTILHSPNMWAYRRLRWSLIERLRRIN